MFNLFQLTWLVTLALFDLKLQVFQNSPKLTILCIFNQLLSTQNVIVAMLNATFSVIFQQCAIGWVINNHYVYHLSVSPPNLREPPVFKRILQ